jgi:two-component system, OmpR family, sensor histidine kinase PrrB
MSARPRSLRTRVVLAAVLPLALSLVVAGMFLVSGVGREGRQAVDEELSQRAEQVARDRGPGPPGPPESHVPQRERSAGGHGTARSPRRGPPPGPDSGLLAGSGSFVRVVEGGEIVDQRGDLPSEAAPIPAREGLSTVRLDGRPWRSLTVSTGRPGARIQFFQTLAGVEARVRRLRRLVLASGLGALALTAVAAWAATSLTLRPLARLRGAAASVSGTQDLRSRLPDGTRDPEEIRALTASLNGMLARLEQSVAATERALRATRRFAADAGHELRTPMTALRANLDAVMRNPDMGEDERRSALSEMQADGERMVTLLEGLQALARGEAAEAIAREPVELGDLVDASLQSARRRHPGVSWELDDASGDARVDGWPDGLRMLTDNLLENAAVHGRPGGRAIVRLRRTSGGTLALQVEDDGPGLPADQRARVLEPFSRGSGVRARGSGLGLAVVAQQAALHGGEVRLGDADAGGLQVEVTLPSAGP